MIYHRINGDAMDDEQETTQSTTKEDNTEQSNNIGSIEDTKENNILVFDPDFWSRTSDFQGLEVVDNDLILGNHPANVEYNSNRYNVFCADTKRNLIYYCNYGSDHYIYQLDGDKSTLLVPMEASHLYVHEEYLYYLGYERLDTGNPDGNLYRYNLHTKELTLLYQGSVYQMWVTSEGIYLWDVIDNLIHCYHISFHTMVAEKLDELYCLPYSDYGIYLDISGLKIRSLNGEEYGTILPTSMIEGPNIMIVKIYNDVLYVSKFDKLYAFDLLTGEKKHMISVDIRMHIQLIVIMK